MTLLDCTIVTALVGCAWRDRFIDIKKIKNDEKEFRTDCCRNALEKYDFVDEKILREIGMQRKRQRRMSTNTSKKRKA